MFSRPCAACSRPSAFALSLVLLAAVIVDVGLASSGPIGTGRGVMGGGHDCRGKPAQTAYMSMFSLRSGLCFFGTCAREIVTSQGKSGPTSAEGFRSITGALLAGFGMGDQGYRRDMPSAVGGTCSEGVDQSAFSLQGSRTVVEAVDQSSSSTLFSRIPRGGAAEIEMEKVKIDEGVVCDTTVTRFVSECDLPTSRGGFRLRAYRHEGNGRSLEPVVLMANGKDPSGQEEVPVRVHDQCLTSEVLGSMRCDCKEQLDLALEYISEHGGCIIYMQQEGRGIGLANKIAAYALQDNGLDTVDANRHLGFEDDLRSYEAVKHILADMRIKSVRLMTNNPFKLKCLKDMGIKITDSIPMLAPPNKYNMGYLRSKAIRMSHRLFQLDDAEVVTSTIGKTTAFLKELVSIRGGESGNSPSQSGPYSNNSSTEEVVSGKQHKNVKGIVTEDGPANTQIHSKDQMQGNQVNEGNGDYAFGRDSVIAAVNAVRAGKAVVVTDDEGRENEGDLIFAAEKATEDLLAFTIRYSSGVICVSLEANRLEELGLPQMVPDNEDPKQTAFSVTVDAKEGVTTGISAGDRAITLRGLADAKTKAKDFARPGHIFPLKYTDGGVLKRGGHTEAALDLARLAGLAPAGVLCEITTKDGKGMARVPELVQFCAEHGLVLTSIQDLQCYIREKQTTP
ncbi:unnamed protein product [Choristocarpus tenellus]